MYLAAVTLALCASYFVILEIYALFFNGAWMKPPASCVRSVGAIFVLVLAGYAVALVIPDLELGNRFLHSVVGGLLTFMICFLAVRDGGFRITRFQFVVMSALIVTALGVLNEHLEFFLQTYVRVLFYSNPNDTWLDLISNSLGIIAGAIIFTPWLYKAKTSQQN